MERNNVAEEQDKKGALWVLGVNLKLGGLGSGVPPPSPPTQPTHIHTLREREGETERECVFVKI